MYNRTRLEPEQRKNLILDAAYKVAEEVGIHNMSIKNVCAALNGTSKTTIRHYFGNLTKLRQSVLEKAVTHKNAELLSQGAVLGIIPEHVEEDAAEVILCSK